MMEDTRKADFMADLQALIVKHKCELTVTDDCRSSGMQSGVCTVDFSDDGDYLEFNLPSWMGQR